MALAMTVNPTFWRRKRVFLTGHTGFKGSWLSIWLKSMGVELTGLALIPPTNPSLFYVANVGKGMTSIIADIRDLPTLQRTMLEVEPDIVFHMAAQPLVHQSYADPVETYSTNVMGTVHLLEAVRHTPSIKTVVVVSTDKCYENKEWSWGYRENDPMGGRDPYSNSKSCSELVTMAYRNSYFTPSSHDHQQSSTEGVAVATARAGNVIGGGDWAANRLVPDILQAIEQNQSVIIRNPHATRPWQHVLEPLSGYLTLAQYLHTKGQSYAEGWNFGPQYKDARPVHWIADKLVSSWGEGQSSIWLQDDADHPHEASQLKLDIAKAEARLNWQPRWQLETALHHVTSWHKAWLADEDMNKMSEAQIQQYSKATEYEA